MIILVIFVVAVVLISIKIRFQVRNFQKDPHRGGYRFLAVGEWDGRTQNFTFLDKEAITWPSRRGPREQETRDSDRGQEAEEEDEVSYVEGVVHLVG